MDGKNSLNMFFEDLSNSDIKEFCDIVAEVVNENVSDEYSKDVADTLSKLNMFQRKGAMSNAYVTNDVTLVFGPYATNMYDTIKYKEDDNVSTLKEVMTHETMHLIQHGTNDKNNDNGIEIGFNRLYNEQEQQIPVESLFYKWILEGGAELGMAKYLNIEPGLYQKNISYINSYNLSRFNEIESQDDFLENVVLSKNIDEAFEKLNLTADNKKDEFLKLMYSIEITQYDEEDFWEYYNSQISEPLDSDEQLKIRFEIRTSAVKYLTSLFFSNITEALHEGKIADLNTAFYLLRLWEIDTYGHINNEFEEINNPDKGELQGFVSWYVSTQDQLLENIAQANGMDLDEIKTMYDNYFILVEAGDGKTENCDLSRFNSCMQQYLKDIKEDFILRNIPRIGDIADSMATTN